MLCLSRKRAHRHYVFFHFCKRVKIFQTQVRDWRSCKGGDVSVFDPALAWGVSVSFIYLFIYLRLALGLSVLFIYFWYLVEKPLREKRTKHCVIIQFVKLRPSEICAGRHEEIDAMDDAAYEAPADRAVWRQARKSQVA